MSDRSLTDVELRHLTALRAVAEEGTFGRAASRLGYTQSAVSQQIAALERIVGSPVFDRPGGPRPVTLTPAGQVLLRYARAIFERTRSAENELDGLRAASAGRLSIGTFQSVSVRVVPRLLTELRASHPGVEVVLRENDDLDVAMQHLLDGESDVAFTVMTPTGEFATVHLFDDPFYVVCPLNSPIVPKRGPVPLARLAEVPLVGQPSSMCMMQAEQGLVDQGVRTNVVFRTGDNGAVQAMVAAGVGHAVMPRLSLDETDPTVIIRETSPALEPRSIGLTYLTGRTLAPIAKEFIAMAQRQCQELRQRGPLRVAS